MQPPSRSTPTRHKPMDVTGWLGFTLPSRQQTGFSAPPRRSKKYGEGARFNAFNKEKYVNARYRFVMKPTGSYSAHFADPDIFLHWPNILQVIVPTVPMLSLVEGEVGEDDAIRRMRRESEEEGQTCPICLGRPVAGRMTKCGHIFCFPCILHYIQLSDIPKSTKCPICGDTVLERLLKSVCYHEPAAAASVPSEPSSSKPAHTIQLTLMQRPKITTLALPRSATWPSEAIPYHSAPFHFAPDVADFSKFMLATPEYMLGELERELEELRQEWRLLDGDDLGRSFVTAAEVKVRKQIDKVREELDVEGVRLLEKEARDGLEAVLRKREREDARDRDRAERAAVQAAAEQAAPAPVEPEMVPTEFLASQPYPAPPAEPTTPSKTRPKKKPHLANNPPPAPEPSFFFYQSSLGANIFLHPLDIRILLAHFKSYSLFPPSLTVTPTDADPGTMNEDLGRRCKYLSHLPAGTDLIFIETDLDRLVSKETLAQFEQPLKARRQKRRDKVRKEDRAKSRWEASERLKLPIEAQSMVRDDDAEFALALARSTLDDHVGSPSSSPTSTAAPSLPVARTWATTAVSTAPRRIESQVEAWEVEHAWEALEQPDVRITGGGGGKKKSKKKNTLVLGGGGSRGR